MQITDILRAYLGGHLLTLLQGFEGLTTEVGAVWSELEASQPELAARAKPFVDQVSALYRERGMTEATAKSLAVDTLNALKGGASDFNLDHFGGI